MSFKKQRGFTLVSVLVMMVLVTGLWVVSQEVSRQGNVAENTFKVKSSITNNWAATARALTGTPNGCDASFDGTAIIRTDMVSEQGVGLGIYRLQNDGVTRDTVYLQAGTEIDGGWTTSDIKIRLVSATGGDSFAAQLILKFQKGVNSQTIGSPAIEVPLGMTLTLREQPAASGNWVIDSCAVGSSSGGANALSGAILPFNAAVCPAGTTAVPNAVGRTIIGSGTYNLNPQEQLAYGSTFNPPQIGGPPPFLPPPTQIVYGVGQVGTSPVYGKQQLGEMAQHWHYVLNYQQPLGLNGAAPANYAFMGFGGYSPPWIMPGLGGPPPPGGMGPGAPTAGNHSVIVPNGMAGVFNVSDSGPFVGLSATGVYAGPPPGGPAVPPWTPPPPATPGLNPYGLTYYNSAVGNFFSYSTSGCTTNYSGECTPPGNDFFYDPFRSGGGVQAAVGMDKRSPWISYLFCQVD